MSLLDDLKKKAANVASHAWDQVNPLDNGRTWQNSAPTNTRPVLGPQGQLANSGATHLVEGAVKPFIATAAVPVEAGRSLLGQVTNNPYAQMAAQQRLMQNTQQSVPGWGLNQATNLAQAGYNLEFKAPIESTLGNQLASTRARTQGLQQFNQTFAGSIARPAMTGIVNIGHASKEQQAAAGLNTHATGAQQYIGDPITGILALDGAGKLGNTVGLKTGAVADAGATKALEAGYKAQDAYQNSKLADQTGAIGGAAAVRKAQKELATINPTPNSVAALGKQQAVIEPPLQVPVPRKASTLPDKITAINNKTEQDMNLVNNKNQTNIKLRSVPESIQASPLTPKGIRESISTIPYMTTPRAVTLTRAMRNINKDPVGTLSDALSPAKPGTSLSDLQVAQRLVHLSKAVQEGNGELADNISKALAPEGTQLGRAVDMFNALNKTTEAGAFHYASKLGAKTDEAMGYANRAADIAKMPEGKAKNIAKFQLLEDISRHDPSPFAKQAVEGWRAALLTAPTTTMGNILSNVIEGGTKQLAVNPVANVLDMGTSLVTGKRSRTFTSPLDYFKGFGKGATNIPDYMRTGYDALDNSRKYEMGGTTFSRNAAGNATKYATDKVYRFLGAQDQPFRYGAREQALAEQAGAAAKNAGLKGTAKKQFIQEFMQRPDQAALEHAAKIGDRSVFGNETVLGKYAAKVKQPVSIRGKQVSSGAVGEFVVPFSQVPASIATRILERSPAGLFSAANEIVKAARKQGFDQYMFTEKLANSAVGTAQAVLVGKALADNNMITLGYPKTDKKEAANWQATGKQPYSIRIAGHWVSLNYVQPFGSILAYGAAYSQARKTGSTRDQAISQAAAEAAKSVTSQSFLQGVSGGIDAINSPEQNAEKYAESAVSGSIPNLIRSYARATDPLQRQTNSPVDAVKAGIPGLRNDLQPKVDVYGRQVPRGEGALQTFFDPTRPSNVRQDAVTNEVDRLQLTDPGNTKMAVTPTPVDKQLKIDKTTVNLNPKQRTDLQTAVGQAIHQAWTGVMNTNAYKSLDDAGKANELNDAKQKAEALATRQYVADNKLGTYPKELDGPTRQFANVMASGKYEAAVMSGSGLQLSDKTSKDDAKLLTDYHNMSSDQQKQFFKAANDNEYKYNLAKYENDINNGKLDKIAKARADNSIAVDKVGAAYPKEIRALYGLSKSELYNVVSNDPNGTDLVKQVVAYGDALQSNNLQDNKFRNTKGAVTIGPNTYTTGSSSTGTGTSRTAGLRLKSGLGTTMRKPSFRASLSAKPKALASTRKAAASAKVRIPKSGAGGSHGPTLRAYKKSSAAPKIAVKKKQLKGFA